MVPQDTPSLSSSLSSFVLLFFFFVFLLLGLLGNIFIKEIVSWLKKMLKPTGLVFAYSTCRSRDGHFTSWTLRGGVCMAFSSP